MPVRGLGTTWQMPTRTVHKLHWYSSVETCGLSGRESIEEEK